MNKMITYNSQKMRSAIMRRVWCSYMLSVALSSSTAWGIAFGASVIGLWKLVSITSIVQNFLNVPVGQAPTYVWQAVIQTEFLVLIAFGIIMFTVLSVGVKFTLPVFSRQHHLSSV